MHADRQTDRRTDSHIQPHARSHAHTRTLACLHVHTMHSGTYARTDRHTHTCSYGGKHPSTNMEVRSWKLEIRNVAHALMNAHMCKQTFRRTNMHFDRQTDKQTDGRTDGLTHTPSRMRAWKHRNACIDERTHVRSNISMHEHARRQTDRWTHRYASNNWTHEHACRQTDGRTDGRTHTYALTQSRMHTHER